VVSARSGFLASVALAVLTVLVAGATMPSGRVPVHFGPGGEPDRWGHRAELVVVLLVVVLALALLMGWLARKAPSLPWELVNIPHREFWRRPENEAVARARLRDDMYVTGSLCMLLFVVLAPLVAASTRSAAWAGWPTLAAIVAACGLLLGGVAWRARFYRVEGR